MAKLLIGTVTYRLYFRAEDDNLPMFPPKENPEAPSMQGMIEERFASAVSIELLNPVLKVIWEWHGDKLDEQFIDTLAYGDNPDALTVKEVVEEHRNYGWSANKDNATPR